MLLFELLQNAVIWTALNVATWTALNAATRTSLNADTWTTDNAVTWTALNTATWHAVDWVVVDRMTAVDSFFWLRLGLFEWKPFIFES